MRLEPVGRKVTQIVLMHEHDFVQVVPDSSFEEASVITQVSAPAGDDNDVAVARSVGQVPGVEVDALDDEVGVHGHDMRWIYGEEGRD